ncbi:hypothetical protein SNEBB_008251 [Seison nebaliae]|nr:hypothetical protein SNEBB_008251 [Seison nebaliae]
MNQFYLFVNFFIFIIISRTSVTFESKSPSVSTPAPTQWDARLMLCTEYDYYTCEWRDIRTGSITIKFDKMGGGRIGNDVRKPVYKKTYKLRYGYEIIIQGKIMGKMEKARFYNKGDRSIMAGDGAVLLIPISENHHGQPLRKLITYVTKYGNITYCLPFCYHNMVPKKKKRCKWLILIIILILILILTICGIVYYMRKKKLKQSALTLA